MRYINTAAVRRRVHEDGHQVTRGFIIWLEERVENLIRRQMAFQHNRVRLTRADAAASDELSRR